MAQARPLSREQWLDEALRVLARDGHGGLRAEPLAKRLGVSRGSFYWHFADVASFHLAVLGRWEAAAVDQPLAMAASPRGGAGRGDNRLSRLIEIAFTSPPALERAVHAWAAVDAQAAEAVAAVNRRRLSLLSTMFEESGGLSRWEAEASAVVLYWAYLGRVLHPDLPASKARVAQVKARLGPGDGPRRARPKSD
jgi:AcrR family transcriptional regulator